jgi:hypothetical protein
MGRKQPEAVECHAGYTYPQYPVAFRWQGERLTVQSVIKDWRSPPGRTFRVEASDGRIFTLTYLEKEDDWEIIPDAS